MNELELTPAIIILIFNIAWVSMVIYYFRENKKIITTIIMSFLISLSGASLLIYSGLRADQTGSSPERIWGQWESIPWILFFGGAVVVLFFAMRMIIEKKENKK